MRIFSFFLVFVLFLETGCSRQTQKTSTPASDVIYTTKDAEIFANIISKFGDQKDEPIHVLIPEIGKYFLGTEYVANTLEVGENEELVVNLRGLDCTTYAENLLALARTIKSEQQNFETFEAQLEEIRYRDGKRDQYPSRLHYFSDWIYNNRANHLVETPVDSFGDPFPVSVDFMSTHPNSYKYLKNNPDFVPLIAQQEKEINSRSYFYLPKEKIEANEDKLREGDIVGITTQSNGLDISHVGILVKQDGRIHLMHASLSSKKVLISEEPLSDFLKDSKTNTGIIVVRPVEMKS